MTKPKRGKPILLSHWQGDPNGWDWQEKAACAGVDYLVQRQFTSLPPSNRKTRAVAELTAKRLNERYCSHCPVISQCREWASKDATFSGIAAGRAYLSRD